MTKSELVQKMAKEAKIPAAAANRALQTFVKSIGATVRAGGKVSISGLGTFSQKQRNARTARNPRTGEAIQVPAKKSIRFRPSSNLKGW